MLWLTLLFLLSFFASMVWAPSLIAFLRSYKLGKQIRLEGPQTHMVKAGTPTLGGWLIIATSVVIAVAFIRDVVVWPVVLAMVGFGVFGSIDDLANMRSSEGLGLKVRYKFFWHTVIALVISLLLFPVLGFDTVIVPGLGTYHLGWWFVPLSVFFIFTMTSGVNEIDGLDGLAGGTCAVTLATFAVLALIVGQDNLAALALIILGSVVAFLWFNVNPARFFMGDAGSLALGASLAVIALMSGWILLLIVAGLIFILELVSVVLQVAYFKLTKGKRLLKMSPLHHHFELSGWPEVQIVQRFWLFAGVTGILAIGLSTLAR